MVENGTKVRIFDTTLRDGEQSPGVSITPEQKVQVAIKLDQLGVDAIEAGFPIVSQGEMQAIKKIKKSGLNAEICGLARALVHDIDSVITCDLSYVHTFIATSDIHMRYKLKMSPEQVMQKAVEAVDYAKSHGLQVEFSAEDATRSDITFLTKVFGAVGEAGADRIDIPDTVGYATPEFVSQLVRVLKENNIRTKLLYETSKSVSNIMGIAVQANKAIIGENAFGHESGIHTHGILNNPLTYEPIDPEMVGRKRWLQAGKHAGTHGIRAMLLDFGIECNNEQLHKIVERQKNLADKGKPISTAELLSIAGEVLQNNKFEERFKLYDFHIVTGMNLIPTAVIRLSTDGKDLIASEIGVGPVDAALKAIQKIASETANVRIREYKLDSITGGSDALAEVSVKVEDKNGNVVSARKAGEDVVVASVQAMMDAINKIVLRKVLYPKK